MNKNKGMQLGAVLAAMLLLSMAFVPVVTAQVEKEQNQLDAPGLDINNLSAEKIESLMTDEQKELYKELSKQEPSMTQVGKDKILTIPTIDASGKVSKQKVKMTHLSETNDTELYLVESGENKELLTVQHIGDNVRVTGYAYDKTKAITEYDVTALRDHGNAFYEVWTENGYLRIWVSANWVTGGWGIGSATLAGAIALALEAIGIALTTIVLAAIAIIVAVVYAITLGLFANPDGTFDYWVEISDIDTFVDRYLNWWPYDFGIIDSYTGLNRNTYIPIPYGPI